MRKMYFPAVRGETATSILGMVSRTTDSPLAKQIFAEVERSGRALLGSLPCRARLFCTVTEAAYGEPDHVLSVHSLLPIHLVGVRADMKTRAVESVTEASRARTPFCHLPLLYQCGNRHGMQCPECRLLAREALGRRVSYCMHCADFVTRCPLHACRLICDEECSNFESLMVRCQHGAMGRNSLRFAGMMHSLADLTPQMPARERVRQLLAAKGYVTCEGHVRVEPLRHALASLFSDGFEDVRLNALIREVDIVATYLRAANSGSRAIHPVLIVLMEWLSMEAEPLAERRRRRTSDCSKEAADATLLSEKRTEWTAFQEQCHGMTRTEIRHRAPALWTWLHRHDAAWLQFNQVPTQRTGRFRAPRALPAKVLERIRMNTRDFRYSADGLEPLSSAYQVRISYGMSVLAFNRAASRLNGAGVQAQLPARREVFVSRRVQQARVLLARSNEAVNESSIARKSRLRTDTINRHGRTRTDKQ